MKLFNQSPILEKIGHRRIPLFLNEFKDELSAEGIALPEPPDPNCQRPTEEEGRKYYGAIAEIFGAEEKLPERLRKTALILEEASSDANRLDECLQRRLPCVGLQRDCPVDLGWPGYVLSTNSASASSSNETALIIKHVATGGMLSGFVKFMRGAPSAQTSK